LPVASLAIDPEQNGLLGRIGRRRGLQSGRHLPRVQGLHATVVSAGRQKTAGVLGAWLTC
jgi:hypothetical protein